MRKTLLVVILGMGVPFDLSAQEMNAPDPRVRVSISRAIDLAPPSAADGAATNRLRTLLAGGRLTGTLLDQDSEALTLRLEDGTGPLRIPRDAIGMLQVSRGRSRKKSTLIGMAGGLAWFAAMTAIASSEKRHYPNEIELGSGTEMMVAGAGAFVAVGALVGWALPPQERWERVEPGSQKLKVGLVPRRGGVGLSVALAF